MSSTNQDISTVLDTPMSNKRRIFASTREGPSTPNAARRSSGVQQSPQSSSLFQTPQNQSSRLTSSVASLQSPDGIVASSDSSVQPNSKNKQRPAGTTPRASRFQVLETPQASLYLLQEYHDEDDDQEAADAQDKEEPLDSELSPSLIPFPPVPLSSRSHAHPQWHHWDEGAPFRNEILGIISKADKSEITPQMMLFRINRAAEKHQVQREQAAADEIPLNSETAFMQQMVDRFMEKQSHMQAAATSSASSLSDTKQKPTHPYDEDYDSADECETDDARSAKREARKALDFEDFEYRLFDPMDKLPLTEYLVRIREHQMDLSLGRRRFLASYPRAWSARSYSTKGIVELFSYFVYLCVTGPVCNYIFGKFLESEQGKFHATPAQQLSLFMKIVKDGRDSMCNDGKGISFRGFLADKSIKEMQQMMEQVLGFMPKSGAIELLQQDFRKQHALGKDEHVDFIQLSHLNNAKYLFMTFCTTSPFCRFLVCGKLIEDFKAVIFNILNFFFNMEAKYIRLVSAETLLIKAEEALEDFLRLRDERQQYAIEPLHPDAPIHATMTKILRTIFDVVATNMEYGRNEYGEASEKARKAAAHADEYARSTSRTPRRK